MAEIAAISGIVNMLSGVNQNQLKFDADQYRKQAISDMNAGKPLNQWQRTQFPELVAQEELQNQQKQAKNEQTKLTNDYKTQMDELNKSFDMSMSENQYVDATGKVLSENEWSVLPPAQQSLYTAKPTDLGLAMKQIVNNFMTTSTTAIKNWAYERGVAGSTIEGTKVNEASTMAQEKAQSYKTNVQGQLQGQKAQAVQGAESLYNKGVVNAGMGVDTAKQALLNATNNAKSQYEAYDPTTDLAALLNNVSKLNQPKTTTGVSDNVFANEKANNDVQNYELKLGRGL